MWAALVPGGLSLHVGEIMSKNTYHAFHEQRGIGKMLHGARVVSA